MTVEMDDASYHLESIEEKGLPVDPINAYNHMAIYLRWCMEHDLMGEEFLYGIRRGGRKGQGRLLPVWICGRLSGMSWTGSLVGSDVQSRQAGPLPPTTMGSRTAPISPATLTTTPSNIFGPERYHSDEFQA